MATDKRELILTRLKTVLSDLLVANGSSADNCLRNALEVPENLRPGIVMNDADEVFDEALNPYGKQRPSVKTIPTVMAPEIYVLLQEASPDNTGPALNQWRAAVIKAVLSDGTLNSYCHEIRYEGFTSALANGRSMEGQAKLNISFVYMLRPDQL